MKVKVCGLTVPENITEIVAAGADYLGFIFHSSSPRDVSKNETLSAWLNEQEEALEDVARIGVFVNAELDYILNIVHDYKLTHVQLHGNESPGYCQELQLLWSVSTLRKASITKAFNIVPGFDFNQTNPYLSSCSWFVFDTGGHSAAGGTGEQWDWELLDQYNGMTPFLLSGGIGPKDALKVRRIKHPQLLGVDLNSRFETEPGIKDASLVKQFIVDLE